MNLPLSLRAESIIDFCAGDSSRNSEIFSTSSGGMFRHNHHSIMFSIGAPEAGMSSMFWVASQNQAPSFRHILVIFMA
ncbi:hypothetical protein P4203_02800 [Pseudomonas aeruginosa]|nr:hypothetical protein [Pseudomonas aeruginosa]